MVFPDHEVADSSAIVSAHVRHKPRRRCACAELEAQSLGRKDAAVGPRLWQRCATRSDCADCPARKGQRECPIVPGM